MMSDNISMLASSDMPLLTKTVVILTWSAMQVYFSLWLHARDYETVAVAGIYSQQLHDK